MLIVLKGTSCPKGSKEGGQQCCQEQGDHSGNPTAGLLCNSGTSQQTQSPQIGEFSEDLPKSGGEGLGLWLRLGGWVGGRKTKETKKLFKQIEQKFFMGIPLPTSAWFGFNQA